MGAQFPERSLKRSPAEGLLAALIWVAENLDEFALVDRFDLAAKNLKDQIPQLKPISELALTVWLLQRSGIQHELLSKLSSWIWGQVDSGKLLTKLLLARNDFLPCCSLFGPLYRLGFRSQQLELTLALLAQSDVSRVLPLPPWGALAVRYNLTQLGLNLRPFPSESSLYVGSLPEPWVVSSEIGYAITHEVFYLTDFGSQRIENESVTEYLKIWLPYWGQIFMTEGDYDLTGEIAMAILCMPTNENSASRELLLAVLTNQAESGYVPGPAGAGTMLQQFGDSEHRRTFLAHYHTTLVALMAYALALSSSVFS